MRTRVFLFTGQTGLNKKKTKNGADGVLDRLKQRTSMEEKWPGDDIQVYCLEDHLPENIKVPQFLEAEESNDKKIAAWSEAFRNLQKAIGQDSPRVALVSLHACFYRSNRLISFVDFQSIRELDPECIITLIDDVYSIWSRVNKREEEVYMTDSYFTLADLMIWRWVEIMLADQLSATVRKPNFVVATKHPARMLYRLLFKPKDYLTVYACIPITEPRRSAKKRREIDEYREKLHDKHIVFDPLTIDEKIVSFALTRQYEGWHKEDAHSLYRQDLVISATDRWPPGFPDNPDLGLLESDWPDGYPIKLDAGEAVEICRSKPRFEPAVTDPKSISDSVLDHHIRFRDFRLIDDVSAMPAYRPQYEGHTPGGQGDELLYAHRRGRYYVIFHDQQRDKTLKGGAFPPLRGKIVQSEAELFKRLDQFHKQQRGEQRQ